MSYQFSLTSRPAFYLHKTSWIKVHVNLYQSSAKCSFHFNGLVWLALKSASCTNTCILHRCDSSAWPYFPDTAEKTIQLITYTLVINQSCYFPVLTDGVSTPRDYSCIPIGFTIISMTNISPPCVCGHDQTQTVTFIHHASNLCLPKQKSLFSGYLAVHI